MFARRRSLKEHHGLKRHEELELLKHIKHIQEVTEATDSETSSSEDTDYEPPVLKTKHRHRTSFCGSVSSLAGRFTEPLAAARANPTQTSLELHDFVQHATRHEIYALRDLLALKDRTWDRVILKDTCAASNYRRWLYKKENIEHHVVKLCKLYAIPLEFSTHLHMTPSTSASVSAETILFILQQAKTDRSVTQITLTGLRFCASDTKAILKSIASLLHLHDRDWKSVTLVLGHAAKSSNSEDQAKWRSIMMESMESFSTLYMQTGIPIDIRPC
jgi:hypothetical protein